MQWIDAITGSGAPIQSAYDGPLCVMLKAIGIRRRAMMKSKDNAHSARISCLRTADWTSLSCSYPEVQWNPGAIRRRELDAVIDFLIASGARE